MRSGDTKNRIPLVILCTGLFYAGTVPAGSFQGNDGSVILRMCKGADKVRALSVMCHSYLNGYIDASQHFGRGKAAFCLAEGDKEKAPDALVAWISAHPDAQSQPAGAVVQLALAERFPCKGGK
jgi:hypothetical protein